MASVADTLFYPFAKGLCPVPVGPVLVLNAQSHEFLSRFDQLTLQQHFKPSVNALEATGHKSIQAEHEGPEGHFKAVYTCLPKNITEAHYLMGMALRVLSEGGLVVAAAENNAGGGRLKKIFEHFGILNVQHASKNHARVVWGIKHNINTAIVEKALIDGCVQKVNGYFTQPGLFCWDRIDRGSHILTQYLPNDLYGQGADFGCGYGYLAHHLMQSSPHIQKLTCLDADARAVAACRLNLPSFSNVDYLWVDLTRSIPVKNLDFIVMNPPFHEGIKTQYDIGQAFIMTAHAALRPGGTLWMVANVQLPYEEILRQHFSNVLRHHEKDGFKIFSAQA